MIIYLLKSTCCLTLLLSFYHLVLEREKMHNFNRFYLLGSVLFSFLVPLSTITIPTTPEVIEVVQNFSQTTYIKNTTPIIIEKSINYTQLFIGIYLLISSIFLIRFGKNLFKIIRKIRLNEKLKHKKAILVLINDEILPHTFGKHIFINKKQYKQGKIEEELFTHELTHVTQKHTLDVLLIEVLQIIFWINPLFIFLKKAIQLNHEFLADETVINQHKNTFHYQHLLLNKAAWNNEYYLASNLNYSLTKKRLLMMTTQSSQTKIWIKKLAVIPLITSFIFLFAERVEAQEKNRKIEKEKKYEISFIEKGNQIELECSVGCSWTKLSFSTKNTNINESGMTSSFNSKDSKFLFSLKKEENRLYLKGLKNATWQALSFLLDKNKKVKINQFGISGDIENVFSESKKDAVTRYTKLVGEYIGNKKRTKEGFEKIKTLYNLLSTSGKKLVQSPDMITKNLNDLIRRQKIMKDSKTTTTKYQIQIPN